MIKKKNHYLKTASAYFSLSILFRNLTNSVFYISYCIFYKEYFHPNFYTFPLYKRLHVNKGKTQQKLEKKNEERREKMLKHGKHRNNRHTNQPMKKGR